MSSLPKPIPGLVIRYSYLWADEHDEGREEGGKDRPSAIVLASSTSDHATAVVVLAITHSPPASGDLAVEIPRLTKRRLGLDDERSWVVLSEANRFTWPGPDLRRISVGDNASVAYGELPADLFRKVRTEFVQAYRERRARLIQRTS
ncbi:MAG: hypothetical protein ACTHOP_07790 [Mesorhizobium sp.]